VERCVTGMAYEMRLVLQGNYSRRMPRRRRSCSEIGAPARTRYGANRRTARADGPSRSDGRGSIGGDPGQLDSRSDDRLHGRTQQPVLSREAQGSRLPDGGLHDRHTLLRHWETHPTVLLTH
jgi:hypothetical protein